MCVCVRECVHMGVSECKCACERTCFRVGVRVIIRS